MFVVVCCCLLLFVVPSGPLSARTERDAVLQGTAVFMSYLPLYAGFRDTMGWGGVGWGSDDVPLDLITLLMLRHALGWGSDDVPLDLITFLDSTIKSARKTFVYTNIYICLYLYIYI